MSEFLSRGKKEEPIKIIRRGSSDDGEETKVGGSWKLAYADFVTAMMAFFLLMWLLSSPKPSELAGLADYFAITNPQADAIPGQSAAQSNARMNNQGGDARKQDTKESEIKTQLPSSMLELARQEMQAQREAADQRRLEQLRQQMERMIQNDSSMSRYKNQISLQDTTEGLLIQLVDGDKRPMFDSGQAEIKPYAAEILARLSNVLNQVENKLVITGHTDSTPLNARGGNYTNWELSSDRANASRREFLRGGLLDDRVLRVTGMASAQPLVANSEAPVNRRIEILVLTERAEVAALQRNILEGIQSPAPPRY
ncbi:MAG: flagellar motor protein MotB [Limnobacter sp.]|nr:flagellar motor protein MotB [Limnobacter sp.]